MAIREWLEKFFAAGCTIKDRTSRELECTRILMKHPRNPVHFMDLDGHEAVGNLWSTRERVAAAMGTTRDDLMGPLMEALARPGGAGGIPRADFMANESTDVDLLESPVPKLFPGDAGRYVTAGGGGAGGGEWGGGGGGEG